MLQYWTFIFEDFVNMMRKIENEFQEITDKQIVDVQNKLNNRPRKILGYKTPAEVFFDTITKSYSVA